MRALDIFLMVIFFNIGLFFVNVVTGDIAGSDVMTEAGLFKLSAEFVGTSILGALIGFASSRFSGADPLQVSVLSAFVGGIATLFANVFLTIQGLATMLDGGTGIASAMAIIFGFIEGFLFVIGSYQLVTGGWSGHE